MTGAEIRRLFAQAADACRVAREARSDIADRQLRDREDAAQVVEARLIREHDEALAAPPAARL